MGPWDLSIVAAGVLVGAAEVVIVARSVWNRRRAGGPSCPGCGYHLGGLVGMGEPPACPECGRRAKSVRELDPRRVPPRRGWRASLQLAVGAALVCLGVLGSAGRWALVPDRAIAWALPWVPPAWYTGVHPYLTRLQSAQLDAQGRLRLVRAAMRADRAQRPGGRAEALNAAGLALAVQKAGTGVGGWWPGGAVLSDELFQLVGPGELALSERKELAAALHGEITDLMRGGRIARLPFRPPLWRDVRDRELQLILNEPRDDDPNAEDAYGRLDAALARGWFGTKWDTYTLASKYGNAKVRREAQDRMASWERWERSGQVAPPSVPPDRVYMSTERLIERLCSPTAMVRQTACDDAYRLGAEAAGALDDLDRLANHDPDRIVQMAASTAAQRVRSEVERLRGSGQP